KAQRRKKFNSPKSSFSFASLRLCVMNFSCPLTLVADEIIMIVNHVRRSKRLSSLCHAADVATAGAAIAHGAGVLRRARVLRGRYSALVARPASRPASGAVCH